MAGSSPLSSAWGTPAPPQSPLASAWGASASAQSPEPSANPLAAAWGSSGGATHAPGQKAPGFLEQAGDVLDVPLAYTEAGLADVFRQNPNESSHLGQVTHDLTANGWNPHTVAQNDVYFRKGSLHRILEDPNASANDKARAQWFLQHPWAAGAADFATEFANPSNLLTGAAGRVVGAIGKVSHVAQAIDEAQALGKFGNRFAGLRVGARDVGADPNAAEQWGRTLVNTRALGEQRAFHEAQQLFGGLTRDEQMEVVHRMQGHTTRSFGAKDAELNARAVQLKGALQQITDEQLRAGTLDPAKVYDQEAFFPMAGAFELPAQDAEYLEFLNAHRSTGGGAGVRLGTAGQNAPRRNYRTLLEAQQQAAVPLRNEWSPGEAYYRFLSQRSKNVEIENSMGDLLSMGLAKDRNLRAPGDRFAETTDVGSIRTFGSPTLRDQAIHEQVVNFLEDVGASKAEASAFAHASTNIGKLALLLPKAYNASQSLLRQGIVFNPIVHAGWNLMFQYLGAGGDIRRLATVTDQIINDAEHAGAILPRGAPRMIGGSSAVPLMLRPWSDLKMGEKIARGGAQVQEANQHIVFDVAEKRYAAALFATYTERGLSPAEAAIRVRQALGDYANVRNSGVDAVLHRAFFFYPWLKTILPFWIKTGATKPQTWNPAVQGVQTHNELAGDPNARTGAESPLALYSGEKQGRPEYYSVPLPQRILEQAGELAQGAATGDRQEAAKGMQGLFLNRLNPTAAGGLNTLYDVAKGGSQPYGLLGYAPATERITHGVESLGQYIPGPIRGAADAYRMIHGDVPPTQVLAELFGGFGYEGLTPAQAAAKKHIDARYYNILDRALRSGDKARAWLIYQSMQRALKSAGVGP